MKFLLPLLFLIPSISFANNYSGAVAAAIAGSAVAGVTAGTQYTVYRALKAFELEGWADKELGSTVMLEQQCKVNAEFHLVGNHRKNFILMGLSNPSNNSVVVKSTEIEFLFNNENSRFPGWFGQPSDQEIKPGWWQMGYIPFPSKEEFAHYKNLEVRIPIIVDGKECVVTSKFTKHKKIIKEEMSYSIFDFTFDGGIPLGQNGSISSLGKPNSIIGLSLTGYFRPNHGFGFSVLSEQNWEGSKNPKINGAFARGTRYEATTDVIGIHYVYRHFLNSRLMLKWEPGFGVQNVQDNHNKDDGHSKRRSSSFAFYQKIMLDWNLAHVPLPTGEAFDFIVGIGIAQIWSPNDQINGQKITGERYGALLRVGMGL